MHPIGFTCPMKPTRERQPLDTAQARFRNSTTWRKCAERVKTRDKYLCLACLHNLPGTVRRYNSQRLSVHHIVPIAENYSLRLSDDNLVTLCDVHHAQAERGAIKRTELLGLIHTPPGGVIFTN